MALFRRGEPPASWFKKLWGFEEFDAAVGVNMERVTDGFSYKDGVLISKYNDRVFHSGNFSLPSVKELRSHLQKAAADAPPVDKAGLRIEHVTGNVKTLLEDASNAGAIFQAASQFNCLEMVRPTVTPEEGITGYLQDRTQGPTCAMACAPGTLYRNYFISSDFTTPTFGQSSAYQVNTIAAWDDIVSNPIHQFWKMQNGYLLPCDDSSLVRLRDSEVLDSKHEQLVQALKVGVQEDTEVVDVNGDTSPGHRVTQVYVSAVPVGYDKVTPPVAADGTSRHTLWQPLAELVLDATYEATFAIAAIASIERNDRIDVFLTKVGGGVFANDDEWIVRSIQKACDKYRTFNINIKLVHYGGIESAYTVLN
eukprot:GSChrysophyteH1.ASY1.ANO1.2453.1 assembled CDS